METYKQLFNLFTWDYITALRLFAVSHCHGWQAGWRLITTWKKLVNFFKFSLSTDWVFDPECSSDSSFVEIIADLFLLFKVLAASKGNRESYLWNMWNKQWKYCDIASLKRMSYWQKVVSFQVLTCLGLKTRDPWHNNFCQEGKTPKFC